MIFKDEICVDPCRVRYPTEMITNVIVLVIIGHLFMFERMQPLPSPSWSQENKSEDIYINPRKSTHRQFSESAFIIFELGGKQRRWLYTTQEAAVYPSTSDMPSAPAA